MRVMAFAAALGLLLSAPALAQAPIATASAGPAAPQPTAAPPPLPAAGTTFDQGPPMAMGPCGPEKIKPDGHLDTAPHGEVDAGVGTNGYREIGGSVCKPIGQDGGFVAVSAGEVQGDVGGYRKR